MTKVVITYHMHRGPHDGAENCITLPMEDHFARNLLTLQHNSGILNGPGRQRSHLSYILTHLARLQGYTYAEFVCAELPKQL